MGAEVNGNLVHQSQENAAKPVSEVPLQPVEGLAK